MDFQVKNRQLLDQAMQEYLAGTRKKYCRSYSSQLAEQRLKIMGKPTNLFTNIEQMVIFAGITLPQLNLYRQLTKIVPKYTQVLIEEKQNHAALKLMQCWKPYLQHQLDDSHFLVNALVLIASANQFKHTLPKLYRELGKNQQAKVTQQQLQQITNIRENWRQAMDKYNKRKTLHKTGILASILLPALGLQFSEKDLAPSRRIEYINVDKSVIAILNILFIGGIVLASIVICSWRWRTGLKAILLTPSIRSTWEILLWGIIIPITGYWLISSLGVIGGHEYGFIYNSALYFQILLLLIFIQGITFYLTKKHVVTRCQQLEIALPEQTKMSQVRKITLWIIIAILGFVALVPYRTTTLGAGSLRITFLSIIALTLISILVLLVHITAKFIISFKHREYAIYYGALAKTLLPSFALAVIFLTLTYTPYLNWLEARLIKQDKVIFGSPNTFTPAESQALAILNAKIAKAIDLK